MEERGGRERKREGEREEERGGKKGERDDQTRCKITS